MDNKKGSYDISKKARKIRRTNPFGDYDKDGVKNWKDCQPFNPKEHISFQDVQRFGQGVYETLKKPVVHLTPEQQQHIGKTLGEPLRRAALITTYPAHVIKTESDKGVKRYHKEVTEPGSSWLGGRSYQERTRIEKDIRQKEQEYEKLRSGYERSGLIKNEEFVGSDEEFKRLGAAREAYETSQEEYKKIPKPALHEQFGKGISEFALGLPTFPYEMGTAIGAGALASHTIIPGVIEYGKGYKQLAEEEPGRVGAHVAGMVLMGGKPLKFKISKATFPKGSAKAFGIKTGKKPSILKPKAYEEFYPLITIGKGGVKRVSIGKPKVKGELFEKVIHEPKTIKEAAKLYEPGTPLETLITKIAIPEEAAKIIKSRGVRKHTIKAGVKPEELTPVIRETLELHGLTKSTDAVIKLLKTEKADLYGSIMQEPAMRKFGISRRTPGDIDVKVTNTKSFAKKAVKAINKAEGREAVILKKGKVKVKKTGDKLFDISSQTEHAKYGEQASDYLSYGLKEEPKIKTKEGITSITLSEQATRKLHGAMKVSQEVREVGAGAKGLPTIRGRIAPSYVGRIKDIADYYFIEKANIAGLKLKHRVVSAKKANKLLEEWLESWGKDVKKYTKDLYAKTVKKEGGEKAWLGSFEKNPISPSQSYKVVSQIKYVAPTGAAAAAIPSIMPSAAISSQISITPSTIPSKLPLKITGEGSAIGASKMPSKISKISSTYKTRATGISKDVIDLIAPSKITTSKIPKKEKTPYKPPTHYKPPGYKRPPYKKPPGYKKPPPISKEPPYKQPPVHKIPEIYLEKIIGKPKPKPKPKPRPSKKKKIRRRRKTKPSDFYKFIEISPVLMPKKLMRKTVNAIVGEQKAVKGKSSMKI